MSPMYSLVLNYRGEEGGGDVTNKLYKGKYYQNFIKCGKIVFRSFSYNNQMNLRVFYKDLQFNQTFIDVYH